MSEANYCSLGDIQRETGNSDAGLEVWFLDCASVASRWIEDYCHRDFLFHDHDSEVYTVATDEIVGDSLFLSWPIITLTEVMSGPNLVTSDAYSWKGGSGVVRLLDGSYWDNRTAEKSRAALGLSYGGVPVTTITGLNIPITLKGTFGHVTPPAAVRMACAKIAAAFTNEKRRERLTRDGQRTSILDSNIPEDATLLLKRFRRLVN